MFWGLTLESGKRYAQQVETSFHVSMAALDVRSCPDSNDSVSVMVSVDKNDFLLCNLSRQKFPQQTMDHVFQAGDQIAFMTKGKGVVHLTGYLMPDDDFPGFEEGDEEGEGSSEEEEVESPPPKSKDDKKRKSELQNSKTKKAKIDLEQMNFDEDSDSEDSDFDVDDESPPGSEEEEEEGVSDDGVAKGGDSDESGEEEQEDSDDSEDSDDDDDDSSETEEESPAPKLKQQAQQQAKQQTKQQQQAQQQAKQAKQQAQQQQKQQKNTPNNKTPTVVNGTPTQQQSGKKNKNDKGETPKSAEKPGQNAKAQTTPQQLSPQKKTLAGGVMIEDVKVGTGPVAKAGRTASVYYCGRLKSNNKQFDATQSGAGFKFRVGQSEVIKGWDVGVAGMKVGGKRKIICPPHMAYGNRGSPPTIPPNSWLVFEVELKAVS